MEKKRQQTLFDEVKPKAVNKEWVDMPEFVQEKQPELSIIVRFRTEEDLQAFAKLINQKLTAKTKSIWYPFKSHWGDSITRWVDEP